MTSEAEIIEEVAVSSYCKRLQDVSVARQILAASLGGTITAFIVCPFDVVKTRLQVQVDPKEISGVSRRFNTLHFSGTLDALVKIARSEGPSSLWRGLQPSLLMAVPNAALYFTSYEHIRDYLNKTNVANAAIVPLIAGSSARLVSATFTAPLELIRTNLQAISIRNQKHSGGIVYILRCIIGNIGWKGLFRGLGPTLLRDVPFSAIYWSQLEFLKAQLRKHIDHRQALVGGGKIDTSTEFLVNFVSGAGAGMVAAILTTPIDVVKTRMQMVRLAPCVDTSSSAASASSVRAGVTSESSTASSAWRLFKNIVHEEGWGSLTKGMLPRAVKVAPACAIMISSYELLKQVQK